MKTRIYLFLIVLVLSWTAQLAPAHARGRHPGGDIETKWMLDIDIPGSLVFTETGALVGERTSILWKESVDGLFTVRSESTTKSSSLHLMHSISVVPLPCRQALSTDPLLLL